MILCALLDRGFEGSKAKARSSLDVIALGLRILLTACPDLVAVSGIPYPRLQCA